MKRQEVTLESPPTSPHLGVLLPIHSNAPFPYADYTHAKNSLAAALNGPCFYATLTGNSGMGKTSLLRELSATLERPRHALLYFSSSRASVFSVSRLIARALHISPRYSYLETVNALIEVIETQKTHFVLWIDEADQLELSTLQEIRMLAESDISTTQVLTVLLSGLPRLLNVLDSPPLFPLKRRISQHFKLSGLTMNELDGFLQHRFGLGANRLVGTAKEELFERTGAAPAVLDTVFRRALEKSEGDINSEAIRAVLDTAGL